MQTEVEKYKYLYELMSRKYDEVCSKLYDLSDNYRELSRCHHALSDCYQKSLYEIDQLVKKQADFINGS